MSRELVAHNRPVFDQLHPRVYGAAVGLVALSVLSAWLCFYRQSDLGLSLAMISVFLLITVLLPWSISLIWKKYEAPYQQHPRAIPFHDWRFGDFAVWGGKIRSMHAAIDVLLPLAAVAFGLLAIGIVFLISANLAS